MGSGRRSVTLAAVGWGVVVGLLLLMAVSGGQVAAVQRLASTPSQSTLDYSPSPPGRLRSLRPSFVQEALGTTFSPSANAGASTGQGSSAAGSGTSVTTPHFACVNGHQTSDPLSPPCVAQFSGDNGGATYRGVSRDEVRVLVHLEGQYNAFAAELPTLLTPVDTLVDLDKPPTANEHYQLKVFRSWQKYFASHYQLFGRHVHLFVWFDTGQAGRGAVNWGRGEAIDLIDRVQPFALLEPVLSVAQSPSPDFVDTFLSMGIPVFTNGLQVQAEADRQPGLLWSYLPTIEQLASLYSSYVCTKLATTPAVWSGMPGDNGHARRFGLLHADQTDHQALYTAIRHDLRGCGVHVIADVTFPSTLGCGGQALPFVADGNLTVVPPEMLQPVAKLKAAHVSTVLWTGCDNSGIGVALTTLGYRPEWILAGDDTLDYREAPVSDLSTFSYDHRAVAITSRTFVPRTDQARCYQYQREVDPSLPTRFPDLVPTGLYGLTLSPPTEYPEALARSACFVYPELQQLVTGLQVAGPRLTPPSMAAGLRSLPTFHSTDPQEPTCSYAEGSSGCIHDASAEYWDGLAQCWRAIDGGARFQPNEWPSGNLNAQVTGREPCNYG